MEMSFFLKKESSKEKTKMFGLNLFGLGKERYKKEVERVCDRYALPPAIKHYFESLPKTNNSNDRGVRVEVLSGVCEGEALSNAVKCLDEIMQIR